MADTKGYVRKTDEKGSINISQSVVATIAAAAASDVDGVYGVYQSPGRELIEAGGKKGMSKGAKITIEDESIIADVYLIAEVGFSVSEVAAQVQKAVMTAVEEAVGFKVKTVNVHVCGISMRKAKTAGSRDTARPANTRTE